MKAQRCTLPLFKSQNWTRHKNYILRVELLGDAVNDDSGSYAEFTTQGSKAWHARASNVLDVISRLPGCTREENDAVSAHPQV